MAILSIQTHLRRQRTKTRKTARHYHNAKDKLSVVFQRNRKLEIPRAPTKAKSQEPAYSQAPNQNKIDRQRSKSRESGRQPGSRLFWMVLRRGGRYGEEDNSG